MARELFIYWKAAPGQLAAAQSAVQAMQSGLRLRHPGLTARLFLRHDDAQATLMETYSRPPAGTDAALQAAIDDAARALQAYAAGPRHVEIFVEIDA